MSLRSKFERLVYETPITQHLFALYFAPWLALTARRPIGTNVFDREWGLLIVLDACRVDALRTVTPEYDWLGPVGATTSVGSTSKEWMINTFNVTHREAIGRTACVTANSWVDLVLEGEPDFLQYSAVKHSWLPNRSWLTPLVRRDLLTKDDFAAFDSVGRFADENPYRVASAKQVTDRAIRMGRETEADRLLVHYMQPHEPYVAEAATVGREPTDDEARPFEALRSGADEASIRRAYLDNLRYVLDSVEVLLRNVNADRVVITADHGELFGEWGLYGHIGGVLHPSLKRVPWAEASASDTGEYVPELNEGEFRAETDDDSAAVGRLQDLGYL
jgi:hypothetical protein